MPEERRQNFTCPDDIWHQVRVQATTNNVTVSEVVVKAIELLLVQDKVDYKKRKGFTRQPRPTDKTSTRKKNKPTS